MENAIEKFGQDLSKAPGAGLVSFVVYGSAAAGDRSRTSDINTLIVLKDAAPAALKSISPAVCKWTSRGNPPPLVFTEKSLLESADIFPAEFFDIIQDRITVAGRDVFKKIKVSRSNLRLEVEREFMGLVLGLRSGYLMAAGNNGRLKDLMRDSVAKFVLICRAALRLKGKKAPSVKKEVIEMASKNFKLDETLIMNVIRLKERRDLIGSNAESVFAGYLLQIEKARSTVNDI